MEEERKRQGRASADAVINTQYFILHSCLDFRHEINITLEFKNYVLLLSTIVAKTWVYF
jgi:hypothetical protein